MQRVESPDFEAKVQICGPQTRAVAYELDKRIKATDLGIRYYEHGSDIRYTHKDIPPLPAGDVHPFVHIRPNQEFLVVHIYRDVDDPKGVTKIRSADSPFQKQLNIRTESDFCEMSTNPGLGSGDFRIRRLWERASFTTRTFAFRELPLITRASSNWKNATGCSAVAKLPLSS